MFEITTHHIPDIVVDGVVDVDDVSLSSFFDDANFPGTQLELFLDFQSFIFFFILLFCQTDVRTEYYILKTTTRTTFLTTRRYF